MSGYTACACRDCFDIAVCEGEPILCGLCFDAGCRVWDGSDGWEWECQRIDGLDIDDVPLGEEWRINKECDKSHCQPRGNDHSHCW